MTGNTFNAANEMTDFNGTPQTYDPHSNLANDGTKIKGANSNVDARAHPERVSDKNSRA